MAIYVEARDNRPGLTTADSPAVTILTIGVNAGIEYYAMLRTYCTAYTSGNCAYTLTWTENGGTRTLVTANQSGANVSVVNFGIIKPDANTSVTVALGAGTATTNVSCALLQVK